ncbi:MULTISPECIES: hypothetical protein [Gordonia]|uniref:Uncharacterized protein n=1 Tax=Gordonia sihwensis NBRC 108236 TaxID=1223544 RepID=L7LLV7_9ACTN|nr:MULTISPECIES: hypothetical protein [Gordonia]GAC62120.1 hypothetical protein GSI01S_29_00080 [Gordonia sihwensis NBRC 108236]
MSSVTGLDGVKNLDDLKALDGPDYGSAPGDSADGKTYMPGDWVKAGRSWFTRISKSKRVPDWQHIALHAWGNSGKNGHCPLGDGELQEILGKPTMKNKKAQEQIKIAIEEEWLGHGSTVRCLILPFDMVYGRSTSTKRCPLH